MITTEELGEILTLYRKHGWEIGSVVASRKLQPVLSVHPALKHLDENIDYDSEIDAIWFKRHRSDGDISWEIRQLSSTPFALCESFPEDVPGSFVEETKKNMENLIRERSSN